MNNTSVYNSLILDQEGILSVRLALQSSYLLGMLALKFKRDCEHACILVSEVAPTYHISDAQGHLGHGCQPSGAQAIPLVSASLHTRVFGAKWDLALCSRRTNGTGRWPCRLDTWIRS